MSMESDVINIHLPDLKRAVDGLPIEFTVDSDTIRVYFDDNVVGAITWIHTDDGPSVARAVMHGHNRSFRKCSTPRAGLVAIINGAIDEYVNRD